MDRKATARQTLEILKNGEYVYQGRRVEFGDALRAVSWQPVNFACPSCV